MHKISWPPDGKVPPYTLNLFEKIDASRTALLVIDLQVGFVDEGFPAYCRHAIDVIPKVNLMAGALRAAGGLIVHTRHVTLDDPERGPPPWQRGRPGARFLEGLRPDADGYPLHPALEVHPGDLVIDKVRYSAMLPISSPLDAELRASGIDTIIVTGTVTNVCCESTARDAHMMGYKVFFISDATAAITDEEHNASLAVLGVIFADVRKTDEMLSLLAHADPCP